MQELTLVGVSVGPGDPELITVKAIRALESTEVILLPKLGAGAGRAEDIVTASVPSAASRLRGVSFSMSRDGHERVAVRDDAAAAALAAFDEGATSVAFASIGDVGVYSTFAYLAARVRAARPDVAIRVVPGVTAMQALAATVGEPLCVGTEILALVPSTAGPDALARVLDVADSVVVYKGGERTPDVVDACHRAGARTVVGSNIGLPEQVVHDSDDAFDGATYFTTVWAFPSGERA